MLDKSVSYATIQEKFGIGKSTVGDIKKNREKILKFQSEMIDMGMSRNAKVMKLGEDKKLDQAVYVWFRQKRMEGMPISGPMLCEKAVELSTILNGETKFTASKGWEWRFCNRHGIRQLGEKLSSDDKQAKEFVASFRKWIETRNLSHLQIFNCDETGLNFRLLPNVTLASSFEKSAEGRKKSKDRVALNLCSNATGTIKLPVHLIGKSNCPRCFRKLDMKLLPVKYTSQSNAWMTAEQFREWFHHDFVPYVQEQLRSLGEEPNAVLVLDNCSAHPDAQELISDDGTVFAKFLPPNVTALIQPMDQGVIQSLKKRYKKKLLRRLIIEDDLGTSIVDFLKGVHMKVVVDLIHEAWTEITEETLRRSWQKIIPTISSLSSVIRQCPPSVPSALANLYDLAVADDESTDNISSTSLGADSRGCGMWRGLRIRISHTNSCTMSGNSDGQGSATCTISDDVPVQHFKVMFQEFGVEIEPGKIVDWLDSDVGDSGVQTYSYTEICELVSQSSGRIESEDEEDIEEDQKEPVCPVTNSDAARMFDRCLTWLEHQPEATVYNTSVLRELHALAAKKRMQSIKQTKLDKYFNVQQK